MSQQQEEGEEETYCGLVCAELVDELQSILDRVIVHSKYDPIFAPVMIDRLIAQCQEAKTRLNQ